MMVVTRGLARQDACSAAQSHLARDGRENAIRRLDELSGGQRPRWTLVDAAWTSKAAGNASRDNGTRRLSRRKPEAL